MLLQGCENHSVAGAQEFAVRRCYEIDGLGGSAREYYLVGRCGAYESPGGFPGGFHSGCGFLGKCVDAAVHVGA